MARPLRILIVIIRQLAAKLSAPGSRRWLGYAVVGVFAAWCLHALRHDLAQMDAQLLAAGWSMLVAATLLSLFNYVLRIARWHLYLRKLGHPLPAGFVALTFMAGFAFTLSPGKLGEMMRARYYRPLGISISSIGGAFLTERLLDLMAMMALASMVLAEFPQYRFVLWWALGLLCAMLCTVALLPTLAPRYLNAAARPSWLMRILSPLLATLSSARALLTPAMLLAGILLGVVAWGAEAWGLKLLTDVVAPGRVGLAGATGTYAIAILVGALSFLPGGLGSTEVVMATLLHAQGVAVPDAVLLTLVCRLLTLWLAVVIGWLCVWMLPAPASASMPGSGTAGVGPA